jgi:integrase
MDRKAQSKGIVNTLEVVTKGRRGGPGKKDKTYKRADGRDSAYLTKRAGSPYWYVRKKMGPKREDWLYESTKTTSITAARLKRDELINGFFGKIKSSVRKTVFDAYEKLRALKEVSLDDLSYRNHYVYPWGTLGEHMGDLFLDELTVNDWTRMTTAIRKNDPDKHMANYYELLIAILNFAVNEKYLKELPKIKLDRSQEIEPEVNPFTDKQITLILKNSEGPLHIALSIMAFKGLRPKEARRLKKSFFDFKEGGINLPGFEKIDGKMVRYTKNGKPRFIPLGILKKKLKAYCNSLETENLFDFTKDSFETEWEILRDSLGLTGGLYRLRHYAAVRMLKAKVNPITVAKVLGHGIQVLFKKYSRFLKQDLNDALKDL